MNRTQRIVVFVLVGAGLAVWANAGDPFNPPSPVGPTMHTLDEIYDLVAAQSASQPVWEYWYGDVLPSALVEVVPQGTSGVLHGLWLKGTIPWGVSAAVHICDGPCATGTYIAEFMTRSDQTNHQWDNRFFQLDVNFTDGLYLAGLSGIDARVTVLYQTTASAEEN